MGDSQQPKKAIALKHAIGSQQVPELVAKGSGEVAERILQLAQEHGVPIHHDPDLVRVLAYLDVGDHIPPEVYRVVAEILAFVYKANSEFKK